MREPLRYEPLLSLQSPHRPSVRPHGWSGAVIVSFLMLLFAYLAVRIITLTHQVEELKAEAASPHLCAESPHASVPTAVYPADE